MLGLPLLDKLHIMALEHQTARLLWLVNELRYRTGQGRIQYPRTEYDLRLDGELADDEELPFASVIVPPSELHIQRWCDND